MTAETPAVDEHRGLWPALDAPGRYRAACSCGFGITGTPKELADWGRGHDDSPRRQHVVFIVDGGKRVDNWGRPPREAPVTGAPGQADEPTPGQVAYEASCSTFPPKARKQQVPYRDIGEGPQAHWEAIANTVLGKFGGAQ